MRHEKVKKQGINGNEKHVLMTKEKAMELAKDGDMEIIPANIKYNYGTGISNWKEKINEVLQENGITSVRKDAVLLVEGVYSFSPEKTKFLHCRLHKDQNDDDEMTLRNKKAWREAHADWWNEYAAATPEERNARIKEENQFVKDYARDVFAFENKHYGKCIACEVHYHETSIHIHTATIPLVPDKENGKMRLSGKEVVGNKAKMSKMQTLVFEEVGKKYGLERGEIKNPGEQKKHTTKAEKKMLDAQEKASQAENTVVKLENRIKQLESILKHILKLTKGIMIGDKTEETIALENAIKAYGDEKGMDGEKLLIEIKNAYKGKIRNAIKEVGDIELENDDLDLW